MKNKEVKDLIFLADSDASSFSSQSSSLRGTPDPFGESQDSLMHAGSAGGGGGNFGYSSFGGDDRSWVSPQRLGHNHAGAEKSPVATTGGENSNTLLSSNIQVRNFYLLLKLLLLLQLLLLLRLYLIEMIKDASLVSTSDSS